MDDPSITIKISMSARHTIRSLFFILVMGLLSCTLHGMGKEQVAAPAIPLNSGVSDTSFLTNLEKEIIAELNAVRTDPKKYADFLKDLKGMPQWNKGLEEAIFFIGNKKPLPPFKASKGLTLAARALVNDRGPEGLIGHLGKDGKSMLDRMNNYGQLEGKAGEYLGYGYTEAAALVARMAIDEGSAGPESTGYLFSHDYLTVGVACGPHKTHRIMCAVDFAGSYKEKPDL